jgi:hypothetical protein
MRSPAILLLLDLFISKFNGNAAFTSFPRRDRCFFSLDAFIDPDRQTRRSLLRQAFINIPFIARPRVSDALTQEDSVLQQRLLENLMSTPSYGMESSDVFYPS